mmetsp:Transcript_26517/g.58093  ORF Transcript_26517/g.58093 Transcript_26517/m.58093 type:complete len:337 (+) Transcript_26517:737-1747(+)
MPVRFVGRHNCFPEQVRGPASIVFQMGRELLEIGVGQFDRGLGVTGIGGLLVPVHNVHGVPFIGGPQIHAGRIALLGTVVVPVACVVLASVRITEPHDPAPSFRGTSIVSFVQDFHAVVQISLMHHGISPIEFDEVLFAVFSGNVQSPVILPSVIGKADHNRHKGVRIVVGCMRLAFSGPVPTNQGITGGARSAGPAAFFCPVPFLHKGHQQFVGVPVSEGLQFVPEFLALLHVFVRVSLANLSRSQRVVVHKYFLRGHAIDRIGIVVQDDGRFSTGGVGVFVSPQKGEHFRHYRTGHESGKDDQFRHGIVFVFDNVVVVVVAVLLLLLLLVLALL